MWAQGRTITISSNHEGAIATVKPGEKNPRKLSGKGGGLWGYALSEGEKEYGPAQRRLGSRRGNDSV